jgi:hypothetical protein
MENERNLEGEHDSGFEIARVLSGFGSELGFDAQTCDEIAEMPFPEAFETAYGYLAQAGLDPDEVLAQFMQETEEE